MKGRVNLKEKYYLVLSVFILVFFILVYSLFLVGFSDSDSNSDIEYYMNQIEELKLTNSELNEIIESYTNNENTESNNMEKSNFEVLNILNVKEICGKYNIIIIIKSNKSSNVQLWNYDEESAPALLVEGIDINIETRNQYLYFSVLKKQAQMNM